MRLDAIARMGGLLALVSGVGLAALGVDLGCRNQLETLRLQGQKVQIQVQTLKEGTTIFRFRLVSDDSLVIASATLEPSHEMELEFFLSSGPFSSVNVREAVLDSLLDRLPIARVRVEVTVRDAQQWAEFQSAYNRSGSFVKLAPSVARELWIGQKLLKAGFSKAEWLRDGNFPGKWKGTCLAEGFNDREARAIVVYARP